MVIFIKREEVKEVFLDFNKTIDDFTEINKEDAKKGNFIKLIVPDFIDMKDKRILNTFILLNVLYDRKMNQKIFLGNFIDKVLDRNIKTKESFRTFVRKYLYRPLLERCCYSFEPKMVRRRFDLLLGIDISYISILDIMIEENGFDYEFSFTKWIKINKVEKERFNKEDKADRIRVYKKAIGQEIKQCSIKIEDDFMFEDAISVSEDTNEEVVEVKNLTKNKNSDDRDFAKMAEETRLNNIKRLEKKKKKDSISEKDKALNDEKEKAKTDKIREKYPKRESKYSKDDELPF